MEDVIKRVKDNKDLGDFKPKFKIGDKVKLNERGKLELFLANDRDGTVIEIVFVNEIFNPFFSSCTYYITDGYNGNAGTWEEFLERDD